MTLIIGIKCKDGIVVGADSMATYGGQVNVQQNNLKVRIFDNNVIAAIAGSQGTSQITLDGLSTFWQSEVVCKSKNEAKAFIAQKIFDHISPYYKFSMSVNQGKIDINIISDLMIAIPVENQPTLMVFDYQMQVIEADTSIYFLTLGSGSLMANPFLKFLDRVFWNSEPPPTVGDGVFGTLWTLQHVIDTNATMGVGGNPQIAILQKVDDIWCVKQLTNEELEEHKQSIAAAEQTLRDFKNSLNPDIADD